MTNKSVAPFLKIAAWITYLINIIAVIVLCVVWIKNDLHILDICKSDWYLIILVCSALAFVAAIPNAVLYGFGVLIETNQKIAESK